MVKRLITELIVEGVLREILEEDILTNRQFIKFTKESEQGSGILTLSETFDLWDYHPISYAYYYGTLGKFYTVEIQGSFAYIGGVYDGQPIIGKFDISTGDPIWIKKYDISDASLSSPEFYAIKIDGSNNIILIGNALYSEDYEKSTIIIKVDTNGGLLWAKHLRAGTSYEETFGADIDSAGNIIGTGRNYTLIGTGAWIYKLNTNGSLVWCYVFKEDQNTIGHDILIDGFNIYTIGWRYGNRIYLMKLDTNGTPEWQYLIGATVDNAYTRMVLAPDNKIVIVSHKYVYGYNDRTQILKYDKEGNKVWGYEFAQPDNFYIDDLAVDNRGSIFLVGISGGEGVLIKWTKDGTLEFRKDVKHKDGYNTKFKGINITGNNDIYIVGAQNLADETYNAIFSFRNYGTIKSINLNVVDESFNYKDTVGSKTKFVWDKFEDKTANLPVNNITPVVSDVTSDFLKYML